MSDFEPLVGKKILSVRMNQSKTVLEFETPEGKIGFYAEGDCCSHSWFEHVSGLNFLVGRIVTKAEDISMGEIPDSELEGYDCVQNYGYRLTTDGGYFEIEMRNESNGYYGGYIEMYKSTLPDNIPVLSEDF
jgi:hypothetical protein